MAGLLHDGQRIGNLYTPNLFLKVIDCQNARCFCLPCRTRKLEEVSLLGTQRGTDWLQRTCLDTLPIGRARRSNKVFESTLQQILCAKAYKEACLNGSGYLYWKSWAKHQPQFQNIHSKQEKKRFEQDASFIREANYVYQNWDKIVDNLTDQRMSSIDARTFSVNYFYRSTNIEWCLSYNETVRPKVKLDENEELPYSQAKLDDIFSYMITTGIFEDIKYDPKLAAGIGESLKLRMTRYSRKRHALEEYFTRFFIPTAIFIATII